MAGNKFTTETLREKLFATIEGLHAGTVQVSHAQAIAKLSGEVCKTIDVEVKYCAEMAAVQKRGQRAEELSPIILGTQPPALGRED